MYKPLNLSNRKSKDVLQESVDTSSAEAFNQRRPFSELAPNTPPRKSSKHLIDYGSSPVLPSSFSSVITSQTQKKIKFYLSDSVSDRVAPESQKSHSIRATHSNDQVLQNDTIRASSAKFPKQIDSFMASSVTFKLSPSR